ncbi:DUF3800 domain-containing protein [Marivirga tractuosa]|uniref:DUF3800 domain-containing protein n=1 Tax=Marivirga tractuosa TaxID=1006 RepID=UPI0035D11C88
MSKPKGFYIFCDESVKKDRYFSNFYGGVLLTKEDFQFVNNALKSKVIDLNLEDSELKWSNINTYRVESYCEVMEVFFTAISNGLIKMRVMFTDNRFIPTNLKEGQNKLEYQLLYYQFIKNIFGFRYLQSDYPLDLELYFDVLPDNRKKNKQFKNFIYGIQFLPELRNANLAIKRESIYEVDSKKHIILQCTDIVLGAIAFRLNRHHKDKPTNSYRRGKRTIAKEKVYKFINQKIREIRPNFNIGISTGIDHDPLNRFTHPYRHWLFIPKEHEYKERK